MTPATDLLGAARGLCTDPPAGLGARSARAVAFLTRQALETALDDYWAQRAPGVGECSAQRPKMLCLTEYGPNMTVSRQAHRTWVILSLACHQHAYELDPTQAELLAWISRVESITAELAGDGARA